MKPYQVAYTLALALLLGSLAACSFKVNADGSKEGNLDAEGLVRVINSAK